MGRQRQFQIYQSYEKMLQQNNGVNKEIGSYKIQGMVDYFRRAAKERARRIALQ